MSWRPLLHAAMRQRFGVSCDLELHPTRDAVWVVYENGCWHLQRFLVDVELVNVLDVDRLLKHIDKHFDERRCYCVPRARGVR